MGLFRIYPTKPSLKPKGDGKLHAVFDAPTLEVSAEHQELASTANRDVIKSPITRENLWSAFSSPTTGLLMCWHYTGTNEKSGAELNRLWEFVTDPQFQPSVQDKFNHDRKKKIIENYLRNKSNLFQANHGWKTSSVSIQLPHEGSKWKLGERDPSIPWLTILGVHHCDITDVITSILQDEVALTFHAMPFQEFWQPDLMIDSFHSVHSLPWDPDDNLKHMVIPIMLWSDATHLANFGDASLWPVYLFFGNQSKYTHRKPTAAACHHIAYIPSVRCLSPDFHDWVLIPKRYLVTRRLPGWIFSYVSKSIIQWCLHAL